LFCLLLICTAIFNESFTRSMQNWWEALQLIRAGGAWFGQRPKFVYVNLLAFTARFRCAFHEPHHINAPSSAARRSPAIQLTAAQLLSAPSILTQDSPMITSCAIHFVPAFCSENNVFICDSNSSAARAKGRAHHRMNVSCATHRMMPCQQRLLST